MVLIYLKTQETRARIQQDLDGNETHNVHTANIPITAYISRQTAIRPKIPTANHANVR